MRLPLAAVAVLLLTAGAANATTLGFTFTGTDTDGGFTGQAVNGTGSVTFTTGLTTVGLGDVTAFSFTTTLPDPNGTPPTMTFTYGAGDLASFAMTLAGTTPTNLSLGTSSVTGTDPSYYNQTFTVTDLNSGDASIANFDVPVQEAAGTVTFGGPTSVPEPASLMLLGVGAIGLLATRRRPA